jgi:spore maturation protein CgeB
LRNYKIIRVSHFYILSAIEQILGKYPDFNLRNYEEQKTILNKEKVYNCAAFSNAMISLGNCSIDIFYDMEGMQKKWAQENNLIYEEKNWVKDILFEQIKLENPDILFFQHSIPFNNDELDRLKFSVPNLKIIILHFAHLGKNEWPGQADLLLLGTPGLVQQYKKSGLNPKLFYHYFDEDIKNFVSGDLGKPRYPITFAGSSGFGFGPLHAERYWALHFLLQNSIMEAWVWEPPKISFGNIFRNKKKFRDECIGIFTSLPDFILSNIFSNVHIPKKLRGLIKDSFDLKNMYNGQSIPKKRLQEIFPSKCHSGLSGSEYYSILANSKISLHKHGTVIAGIECMNAGNIGAIRLFEATGLGSCLLTDSGPNMSDLFEDGKEILTYKTNEEAKDKIEFYLNNENERKKIADAGKVRTLRDHTAKNRCEQLHDWINNLLVKN